MFLKITITNAVLATPEILDGGQGAVGIDMTRSSAIP
jgi:hypothetical protein